MKCLKIPVAVSFLLVNQFLFPQIVLSQTEGSFVCPDVNVIEGNWYRDYDLPKPEVFARVLNILPEITGERKYPYIRPNDWVRMIKYASACNVERKNRDTENTLGELIFGRQRGGRNRQVNPPEVSVGWLNPIIEQMELLKEEAISREQWQAKADNATEIINDLSAELTLILAGGPSEGEFSISSLTERYEQVHKPIDDGLRAKYKNRYQYGFLNIEDFKSAARQFRRLKQDAERKLKSEAQEQAYQANLLKLEKTGTNAFERLLEAREDNYYPKSFLSCRMVFTSFSEGPQQFLTVRAYLGVVASKGKFNLRPVLDYEGYSGFAVQAVGLPSQVYLFLIDGDFCFLRGFGGTDEVLKLTKWADFLLLERRLAKFFEE